MKFNAKKVKKILVLGDCHLPFVDWEALRQAKKFSDEMKPDLVISAGDLTDQKAWSRFQKHPADFGPNEEWKRVKEGAKRLHEMFPNMIIIDSNHDRRYKNKADEAGLAEEMVKTLPELFPYKGWKWHLKADPLVIGNTAFCHGDELQGSVLAKVKALGMNVVQGHTHQGNLCHHVQFNKRTWGMDVGCLINPKAAAFDYSKKNLSKVWRGFGWIQDNVPHLIPRRFKRK